jgi:hypothetical protein
MWYKATDQTTEISSESQVARFGGICDQASGPDIGAKMEENATEADLMFSRGRTLKGQPVNKSLQ